MIVGSDCSFIFWRSRLTNTAATRVRSSGLPVSFSMIEASTTSCSGDLIGRSGARRSQISCSCARCACCMRWIICSRVVPRGEPVGLRQQRALARNFADVAGEHIVFQQPLHGLVRGQTLGDGESVLHHLAFDDGVDHVAQARLLGELVFAVFDLVACLHDQPGGDEQIGLVDHAGALSRSAMSRMPAARHVDHLVLGQRPRRSKRCLPIKKPAPAPTSSTNTRVSRALPAITIGLRARWSAAAWAAARPRAAPQRAGCAASAADRPPERQRSASRATADRARRRRTRRGRSAAAGAVAAAPVHRRSAGSNRPAGAAAVVPNAAPAWAPRRSKAAAPGAAAVTARRVRPVAAGSCRPMAEQSLAAAQSAANWTPVSDVAPVAAGLAHRTATAAGRVATARWHRILADGPHHCRPAADLPCSTPSPRHARYPPAPLIAFGRSTSTRMLADFGRAAHDFSAIPVAADSRMKAKWGETEEFIAFPDRACPQYAPLCRTAPQDQRSVGAAEAERVRQHNVDVALAA